VERRQNFTAPRKPGVAFAGILASIKQHPDRDTHDWTHNA